MSFNFDFLKVNNCNTYKNIEIDESDDSENSVDESLSNITSQRSSKRMDLINFQEPKRNSKIKRKFETTELDNFFDDEKRLKGYYSMRFDCEKTKEDKLGKIMASLLIIYLQS